MELVRLSEGGGLFRRSPMLPMIRLQVGKIHEVGDEHVRGTVYKLYDGVFGEAQNLIVKKTTLRNLPLVENDVSLMQRLSSLRMFQRFVTVERDIENIYLAVEAYAVNCWRYVAEPISGRMPSLYDTYNPVQVVRGLFEAVNYLHQRSISHGDIRVKNVGIALRNGKL